MGMDVPRASAVDYETNATLSIAQVATSPCGVAARASGKRGTHRSSNATVQTFQPLTAAHPVGAVRACRGSAGEGATASPLRRRTQLEKNSATTEGAQWTAWNTASCKAASYSRSRRKPASNVVVDRVTARRESDDG
eukprot:4230542-Pleurochrysis_carterae.AAC.4